jgi:hypothetical protein|uniref:hypothetical protein n=1 Tax=Fluviicola sp. TaxID=1917219 RepID=UPI00404A0E30
MEPIIINKEQIKDLSFKSPLSFSQDENIHKKLEAATRLGNGYQTKITIVFQDDEGLKRVDTTIWATGQKYICLKGGMWIPINQIVSIEM